MMKAILYATPTYITANITGIGHKFDITHNSNDGTELHFKCQYCQIKAIWRIGTMVRITTDIIKANLNCEDICIKDIIE